MYTDSDPQFLAPAWSLEIGQEYPVFLTWQPGTPTNNGGEYVTLFVGTGLLMNVCTAQCAHTQDNRKICGQ